MQTPAQKKRQHTSKEAMSKATLNCLQNKELFSNKSIDEILPAVRGMMPDDFLHEDALRVALKIADVPYARKRRAPRTRTSKPTLAAAYLELVQEIDELCTTLGAPAVSPKLTLLSYVKSHYSKAAAPGS